MNKKRTSLKALILVPVFILGILSVLSNVMAVNNIRKVNRNASRIADDCMNSIFPSFLPLRTKHSLYISWVCPIL